jgi:hypothetical protein
MKKKEFRIDDSVRNENENENKIFLNSDRRFDVVDFCIENNDYLIQIRKLII